MTIPDNTSAILDRIVSGKSTESDLEIIRRLLAPSDTQSVVQIGKYNVNLGQGQGDFILVIASHLGETQCDAIAPHFRSSTDIAAKCSMSKRWMKI